MTPEESEEVARLLGAARADLRAAKLLAADADEPNEVIGFTRSRPSRRAIKTVLVASGVEIPHTHDLGFLLDIVEENTIGTSESVAQGGLAHTVGRGGTVWGVCASLDREAAVTVADDAVDWAAAVAEAASDS
ncbi:MAG: hypothetical protein ACR2MK_03165 [Solirubrobacteraceae bacterium]